MMLPEKFPMLPAGAVRQLKIGVEYGPRKQTDDDENMRRKRADVSANIAGTG
jgi:hypothetical protein